MRVVLLLSFWGISISTPFVASVAFQSCIYVVDVQIIMIKGPVWICLLSAGKGVLRYSKSKSWSSSAGMLLRFPPSRRHTSGTCHSIQIPWNHSYSWWEYVHSSSQEDGRQFQVCHSQSFDFSTSSLWLLICMVVKYVCATSSLTHVIPQIPPHLLLTCIRGEVTYDSSNTTPHFTEMAFGSAQKDSWSQRHHSFMVRCARVWPGASAIQLVSRCNAIVQIPYYPMQQFHYEQSFASWHASELQASWMLVLPHSFRHGRLDTCLKNKLLNCEPIDLSRFVVDLRDRHLEFWAPFSDTTLESATAKRLFITSGAHCLHEELCWWRQNFRGGCAQQRLETGLPSESPSVFPLMTLTDSWPCREVLTLPWIQFRSLIVIMLMTLLSLQTQLNVYSSS